MAKLTALSARALSSPGRHGDGDGLYLNVSNSGTKSWVQRIVIEGRRRDIGLGSYPAVSLAKARSIAQGNRWAVSEGRNPLEEKQEAREAALRPTPRTPSFAEAAESVIELRRPTWSNSKHAAQWQSTLATYAYPSIGTKLVEEITSGDVLSVLTPIWTSKPETASRVRQRLETVFDWAVAQGLRLDNPASKAVTRVLPRLSKTKNHHPALAYQEVPATLIKVRDSTADPMTKLSFQFLVLTAARSGEVRLAEWSEIEWESRTWTVPPSRMKARREHRVPLSNAAMEILAEAKAQSGDDKGPVFPAPRTGKPLSNVTHLALLRRLAVAAVPHGFRSSFRDWCIEQTDTPWAVCEAALAHNLGNSTETAYARSDLFEKRRELMDAWAEFLCGPILENGMRGG